MDFTINVYGKWKIFICWGSNVKGFYIINVLNHQLIKNFLGSKIICSIIKSYDNLILCSLIDENENISLDLYEFIDNNFVKNIQIKMYIKIIFIQLLN